MSYHVLRDYQEGSREAIYQTLGAEQRRALLYLPTGAGKTETAFSMICEAVDDGHRVLVILDQITLARQWIRRAEKFGLKDVGVLRGSDTDNTDAPLIIASAQTLDARQDTTANEAWLQRFKLVIVDECHIQRKAHTRAIDAIANNGGFVVGMTATPDSKGLKQGYEEMIVGARITDLVPQYLSPCDVKVPTKAHTDCRAALNDVRIRAGEYHQTDLGEAMADERLTASALKVWQEYADNRPTLVFCVDKSHAHAVGDQFKAAGITSAVLTEETPADERDAVIEQFTEGKITALISVMVLAVGFDAPCAEVGLMLRPTKSMQVWIQQCGRLLRKSEGKSKALILDLAGNALNLCHPLDYLPPKKLLGKKEENSESTPPQKVCPACESVISRAARECPECGEIFTADKATAKPGTGEEEVLMALLKRSTPANQLTLKTAYLMFLHIARSQEKSDGKAYYQVRAFWENEHGYEPVVPYRWKKLAPIEPVKAVKDFSRKSDRQYAQRMAAENGASGERKTIINHKADGRVTINVRGY